MAGWGRGCGAVPQVCASAQAGRSRRCGPWHLALVPQASKRRPGGGACPVDSTLLLGFLWQHRGGPPSQPSPNLP